jgi:NAD(P)-dependent dehydrogenase (short-subunit alcohol dehydrogenase family)
MSISSSSKGAAIVTGSAQGIGLAIARKLAEDGYGVVLADVSAKEKLLAEAVDTIKSKGFRATSTIADVSVEQDVKNLVQKAVSEFEYVDVVRGAMC